ncbi:hypothetical protein A2U01_0106903, partial [Trifolium medium]|nr:hypothetical protein [Trifolium medium]
DESSTESDDVPLAQRLKQKTSQAYAKEMHKKFSTDTAEIDKEADTIIQEGIARFGQTPNPDAVAVHLFQNKQ